MSVVTFNLCINNTSTPTDFNILLCAFADLILFNIFSIYVIIFCLFSLSSVDGILSNNFFIPKLLTKFLITNFAAKF